MREGSGVAVGAKLVSSASHMIESVFMKGSWYLNLVLNMIWPKGMIGYWEAICKKKVKPAEP